MSDELRDLYQEVILDHSKRPRNKRLPENREHLQMAHGDNPLCGDKVQVFVKVEEDRVTDVSFEGDGCAISTASASMMTEALKGKTRAEVESLFQGFHQLLTSPDGVQDPSSLGKLQVFAGVREFPIRVKCATLAWHTLQGALKGSESTVTTE